MLFIVVMLLAVVVIFSYFWQFSGFLSEKQDVWGQFGDYIGGTLNPLFSLITFLALLYTIRLQNKELETINHQKFETTFFQMLGSFDEVVRGAEKFAKNIDGYETEVSKFKGRLCLVELAGELKRLDVSVDVPKDNLKDQCRNFYSNYSYLLGLYFRTLFSIVAFVDNSQLNDKDKKFYINIVRARLSEHELVLLFYKYYSCLGENNTEENFFLMVEKYQLLKYLNHNLLANPEDHKSLLNNQNEILDN
jgi:hypothetical protein